jgi:N-carbamoylputrescine amidase
MNRFRVALLQLAACGTDQDANLAKGDDFCRRAAAMGADLALFPEMWNIGYTPFSPPATAASDLWRAPERWDAAEAVEGGSLTDARARWQARAIGPDDPFVVHFRELARELGMAIALTYLERWSGQPRNTLSLIDRRGEIVLTYAKVHTCDFDNMEWSLTPGDDFPVCRLQTASGEVSVGAMICYDREFPESARILMLNGAEILLTPNACGLGFNRLAQFRTRAYENMVGVAMANYAAPQHNGHSVAYDGIAYDPAGNERDMLIVEAGEHEGVYLADFDLDRLRTYRTNETLGNAFRRPRRYGMLTATDVAPPFVRINARGESYHEAHR